ncbi:TPA: hypothetical protein SML71_002055 [Serratia marcescens]|nr:hypothetical protein [Serratia marcescens]
MDNKLSELSKPIGIAFKSDIELMQSGRMIHGQMTVWRGSEENQVTQGVYSQEYVSALLSELEATRNQSQELAKQCGRLGARAAIAERKLATPVRLPNKNDDEFWFDSVFQVAKFDRAVERAISAAGFKFVGDEQS